MNSAKSLCTFIKETPSHASILTFKDYINIHVYVFFLTYPYNLLYFRTNKYTKLKKEIKEFKYVSEICSYL